MPDAPPYDPSLTRIQARPENTRHIRHAALMARWPVIAEPWAQKVAAAHGAVADGTPAAGPDTGTRGGQSTAGAA
jgi:hypothetical protein